MWLGEAEDYIAAATAVSTLGATVFSSTCRSRHARSVAPAHLAHDLVDATDGGANARGRVTRCVMPRGRRAIGAAEDRPERLVDGVAEMIAQLLQPIQLRRPYRDLGVVGEHVAFRVESRQNVGEGVHVRRDGVADARLPVRTER